MLHLGLKNPYLMVAILCLLANGSLLSQACPIISSSTSSPNCNPSCQACPTEQITFSVTGSNLPNNGTIDWYQSTIPGFDPYLGQGTLVGSAAITTPTPAPCTDCPQIMAIMVDACGAPEQANEFMMISSGTGFFVNDLVLDFDIDNNGATGGNGDIGIPNGTCNWIPGNTSLITGCSGTTIIAPSPGEFIPAGATVILLTSNSANTVYDFSSTCGIADCIYVIQNSCARSTGAFSNCDSNGLKDYEIRLNSCACVDMTTIDTDDPFCSSGMGGNGMYFIPGAGYGNDGCNNAPGAVAPPPTPSVSTVGDFTYTIDPTDCNQGPLYFVGIPNPAPSACCPVVYTDYFEIDVTCPSLVSDIDMTECDNGSGQATFDLTSIETTLYPAGASSFLWFTLLGGFPVPIVNPSAFVAGDNTSVYAVAVDGCNSELTEVTLFVVSGESIMAGPDQTSCGSETISLLPTINPVGMSTIWTTTGDGVFSNPLSPTTGYVPGLNDIANGTVTLTISPNGGGGPCAATPDDVVITLLPAPTAAAGGPYVICSNEVVNLMGVAGGGNSGVVWNSFGDGTFANANDANTTYTPGPIDIAFGTVTLEMTTLAANSSCTDAIDLTNITINASPLVNVSAPTFECGPIVNGLSASINGTFGSITWSSSGNGTFTNPNGQLTDYNLGSTDVPGSVLTLTATVTSTNGCPPTVVSTMIDIGTPATFNMIFPTSICAGDLINLDFMANQPIDNIQWTTSGSGVFFNANALVTSYTPSATDISNGNVLLTLNASSYPCSGGVFNMGIVINPPPELVISSTPLSACAGQSFDLSAFPINTNTGGITWSTTGDGSFTAVNGNNTTYNPGPADIASGTVLINVTSESLDPNCSNVTQDVNLTITPGPTAAINITSVGCGTDPVGLNATLGGGATIANWTSAGDGTFDNNPSTITNYSPGPADIAAGQVTVSLTTDTPNGSCPPASVDQLIIFNPIPQINVIGQDIICGTIGIGYEVMITGASSGIQWTTSGNGTFTNPNGNITNYVLGSGDAPGSTIILTANVSPTNACPAVTQDFPVMIGIPATITQNNPTIICAGEDINLNWTSDMPINSLNWTSSGDGSFSTTTNLITTYTPGPTDIANGNATLSLLAVNLPCTNSIEQVTIGIIDSPDVLLSSQPTSACAGEDFSLTAIAQNANTGAVSWTTSGDGTFSSSTGSNTIYTPGTGDNTATTVTITATAASVNALCDPVDFTINLDISQGATVSIIADAIYCGSSPFDLSANIGGAASDVTWTTTGDGTFSNTTGTSTNYDPGILDFTASSVTITATTDDPPGTCPAASETITIPLDQGATFQSQWSASACTNWDSLPMNVFNITPNISANDFTWSSDGSGTFDMTTGDTVVYYPDPLDFAAGAVNFTVISGDPTGPCAADTVVLTTLMFQGPEAGTANTSLAFCNDNANSIVSLFDELNGEDAGGIWTETSLIPSTGAAFNASAGTFDYQNQDAGTYTFEYAVTGIPACGTDTETVSIEISAPPEVTLASSTTICNTTAEGSIINFNSLIQSGTTTGTWTDGTSGVDLSNYASVDFDGVTVGSYTFTYTTTDASLPCTNADFQTTIIVESCVCPSPSTLEIADQCNNAGNLDLSVYQSSMGTWSITSVPSGSNPAMISGTNNLTLNDSDAGTYELTFTLDGAPFANCPDSSVQTIEVIAYNSAGIGSNLNFCQQGNIDLNNSLSSADAGGTWQLNIASPNPLPAGSLNSSTGTLNTDLLDGAYWIDYVQTNADPCLDDAATFIIEVGNPTVDITGTATCGNLTETLTASAGFSSYTWSVPGNTNQVNVSSTGWYYVTIEDANACEDIDSIFIELLNIPEGTLTGNYCVGDVVTVGTDTYDSTTPSGQTTLPAMAANGCDSLVNVMLTFTQEVTLPPLDTMLCPGESITINGTLFDQSNTSGQVTFDNAGCDSTQNITVGFHTIPQGTLTGNYCVGDVVTVGTDTYDSTTPSGQTTLAGMSVNGCDSLVNVMLTFTQEVTLPPLDTMLCPGESITINGTLFDQSNTSGQVTFDNAGCDSTQNITVGFYTIPQGTLTGNYCVGDVVTVGTDTYDSTTPSGQTTLAGMSDNGCDSLVNVMLTFTQEVTLPPLDTTLCPGESITINGTLFDQTNTTGQVTFDNSGCDSTQNITVGYFTIPEGTLTGNYCVGDVVTVGTDTYDSTTPSGQTTLAGMSDNGCDSLVNVMLTFTQEVTLPPLDTTLCPGESITINGTLFDQTNASGQVTFDNAGCDSTQNITVGFYTIPQGTLTGNYCVGDLVTVGPDTYDSTTPSGQTTLAGMSVNGCDSLVNVMLTFTQDVVLSAIDTTLCEGESLTVNGVVFDQSTPSGSVTYNNSGCDSTQNVTVQFVSAPVTDIFDQLCSGASLVVGGDTYNETNPFGQTILAGASQFGCDSIVNVDLSFEPILIAAINSEETLCESEDLAIEFEFNGSGMFDVEMLINGSPFNFNNVQNGDVINVPFNASAEIVLNTVTTLSSNCTVQLPLAPLEVEYVDIDLQVDILSQFDQYQVSCDTESDGVVELISNASGNLTYQWNTGIAPDLNQLSAGSYEVTIIDENNCSETASFTLEAPPAPSLNSEVMDPSCTNDDDGFIVITDIQGNTSNFEYAIDGGDFQNVQGIPFVISNLAPGSYDLTVADENGCASEQSITLATPTNLFAEIDGQEEIFLGDSVELNLNLNFTPAVINWSNVIDLTCPDCLNTYAYPTETTTYEVEVYDDSGCLTNAFITIQVSTPSTYIPNAFSPNDDGNNDVFFIQTELDNVVIEQFIIVDRWGEVVFQNEESVPNQAQFGWDGKLRGMPLNPGVFVYYAVIRHADGTTENFKGDVTLMR